MPERRISVAGLQTRVERVVAADTGLVVLACAALAAIPPVFFDGVLWALPFRYMVMHVPAFFVGAIWVSRARRLFYPKSHVAVPWTRRRVIRAVCGTAVVLGLYAIVNFFAFVFAPDLTLLVLLGTSVYFGPAFAIAADGVAPARALSRSARMPDRLLAWLAFHLFVVVAWFLGVGIVWLVALVNASALVGIGLACLFHAICLTALGLALAVITHDHELRTKDNADRVARVF